MLKAHTGKMKSMSANKKHYAFEYKNVENIFVEKEVFFLL
jgi:hypothetical protein